MILYKFVVCLSIILTFVASSIFAEPAPENQERTGEIIASIDFDPAVNGFSFRNFGKNPGFDNDLTADDLIRMFGAENVCIEGTTARDCVLYETADRWVEETVEKMNNGHCDGFSIASLRMFVGRPFKGRKTPADFQAGAVDLFDLKKTPVTSNYVSYYQTLNFLKETSVFRAPTFDKKPSELLKMLAEEMESKKDYYTLEVWMRDKGKLTRGHSIVPIAIEDMGGEIYRIHVYDNNYPGQTKYVIVDANNETWRYHTANNPAETAHDYVGNASTKTLAFKRLSDRSRKRFECPFCDEDEEEADDDDEAVYNNDFVRNYMVNASFSPKKERRQTAEPETMTISTSGDVDVLVTDPIGRRIGYDAAKEASLNEIPGAIENVITGDGEDDVPPDYLLPLNPANKKPYKITLGGTDSKETADLQIYGAGFVAGFSDISVEEGEKLNMMVSPDGHELSFTSSADGETPLLYITTDDGPEKPSYEFEIGGIELKAGKTVSIKLDLDKGLIYFKDNDGDEDKYDVKISRTNPNGEVDEFDDVDLELVKNNSYVLNFGAWDGKGKMCVKGDADNNGNFDNDDCTEVQGKKTAAKP